MDKPALERTLDDLVSKYVRLSYSENGYCSCYTCDVTMSWKSATCGHGILRGHRGTRWDVRILRPQCSICQCSEKAQDKFEAKLRQELGSTFDKLERVAHTTQRFTQDWLTEKIKEYREKVRKLEDAI